VIFFFSEDVIGEIDDIAFLPDGTQDWHGPKTFPLETNHRMASILIFVRFEILFKYAINTASSILMVQNDDFVLNSQPRLDEKNIYSNENKFREVHGSRK